MQKNASPSELLLCCALIKQKKYGIEFEGDVGVLIRNTSVNSWNLHETSVIPTRETEIRNTNLTQLAAL